MVTKKTTKNNKKKTQDSVKSLREKIKSLEIDFSKQSEEVDRITDKNIRLLAEFDNYKRRTQNERSKLFQYAGEELAKTLLPILDDLQRTLQTDGKTKAQTILSGVELILDKLIKTLENQGIIAFDSIGQDFDPELHEALMSKKSKKGDGVILQEFEKGYKFNEKILRHAKVIVSKN